MADDPNSLESQLGSVFLDGLKSNPDLRRSLEDALTVTGSAKPSPGDKATKAEANYREADSEEDRCGNCAHFDDPKRCELVSGAIAPDMVCDYFDTVEGDE